MVHFNSIMAIAALFAATALAAPSTHFPQLEIRQKTGNVTTVNAGAGAVGKAKGSQFTGGGCVSDADCGTKCCAGGAISGSTGRSGVGICSGKGSRVEFQKGKTGCGFQDPNATLTLQEAAAQVAKQGF